MDYEKEYKEAIERARKELKACGSSDCDTARQIFRFFPELKENEDERIRKELIELISCMHDADPRKERWLAWFEKQGEPQKELAETYLAVFDKKFPTLPTLKGKQLADYKDFLNKCQQIFGLQFWGSRPTQAKLFEKLSLLWATWGAEHLQNN